MAPGANNPYKGFGEEVNHMTIFGPYKHKYESKPGPGYYQPDVAGVQTLPRSKAAYIKDEGGYKVERENGPAPG